MPISMPTTTSTSAAEESFDQQTAPLRREIVAHCYRVLASWDDAEDAAQETYVRAWRAWDGFEGRSSVRTWLHRIATNVALNAARSRSRRAIPSGLGATRDAAGDRSDDLPPETWVQPIADSRTDLRLAIVAGMQMLPPAQRAVLVLREALGFSAAETAETLGITVAAVKSSLQRARARMAAVAPDPHDVVEPTSPGAQRLLGAYVQAFETGDVDVLTAVLRADAALDLIPAGAWFAGPESCTPVLTDAVALPGGWRMEPTVANGQPAVRAYLGGEPYGVAVLDVRRDGIAAITVFADPRLVARFTPSP